MDKRFMDRNTLVRDVMTSQVITLRPEDTLQRVKQLLEENQVNHLPVLEGRKVRGIISRSDYLSLLHGFTIFDTPESRQYNRQTHGSLLVKEVMTKDVITVRPDDTVRRAAEIIAGHPFHALPVVDDGELVGIITTLDLLRFAYLDD